MWIGDIWYSLYKPHQTFQSKSSPKRLQTRVRWKAGFFLTIQKDRNHYGSTGRVNSRPVLPHSIGYYCRIGHRIGQTWPIRWPIYKFQRNKKKSSWFLAKSGTFWWRLLDSNQWPPACEDLSGRQCLAIRRFPVGFAPLFWNRQEVMVHCVRSLISGYWSTYWSKPWIHSWSELP